MTELLTWLQTYAAELTVGAFFALQMLLLLLLLVNGHRIKKMRRTMNQITKQAENFLQGIKAERKPEKAAVAETGLAQQHIEMETQEKSKLEEEENGLITTVLREIFP